MTSPEKPNPIIIGLIVLVIFYGIFTLNAVFGEITISDPLNESFSYPAETYKMTDAEFFDWATKFNQQKEREVTYSDQSKWLEGTGVRIDGYTVPVRVYEPRRRGRLQGHAYRPNRSQRTNITRETYPTRYLNPEYVPPTPLMILNPYCPPTRE